MKKVHTGTLIATMSVLTLFAGCTTVPGGPSDKAADTPPQIVTNKDQQNVWNNPTAFGPVPKEFQAVGDQICQASGFTRATGYHPKAKDVNGNPIPIGGFFCVDPATNK